MRRNLTSFLHYTIAIINDNLEAHQTMSVHFTLDCYLPLIFCFVFSKLRMKDTDNSLRI